MSDAAPRATPQQTAPIHLAGADVAAALRAAAAWLERNAAAIDAINVFPVPDGDTGSNMAATVRDALARLDAGDESAADRVLDALARAALLTARGNSGVILSQWLRGLADGAHGQASLPTEALVTALQTASRTAYAAVREPKEGTILTVARAAAEGAAAAARTETSPAAVLDAAVQAAREALERTPELLPVLKEAGVVDSGGLGLVVLLEGMARSLHGEALPERAVEAGRIDRAWLDQAAHASSSRFRYCTEFIVETADGDDALRAGLEALGDSLLIVGERPLLHVHLHTDDPGSALRLATERGDLLRVKVENMGRQTRRLAEMAAAAAPIASLGVLAIVPGPGFAQLARDLGATGVLIAESGRNPSVNEIVGAAERIPAATIIVLPNHPNVIMAAEQAAAALPGRLVIVPTRSAPAGMSALTVFDPEQDAAANAEAMRAAAAAVRTVAITRAARSATIAGEQVAAGTPIALIDDVPVAAAETPAAALEAAIAQLAPDAGATIALYGGSALSTSELADMAARLHTRFPDVEIETFSGGQPLYDVIASVE